MKVFEHTPHLDFSPNPNYEPEFRFYDTTLLDAVNQENQDVHNFFRLLALCHTVMPEERNGKLEYQAQSPDEAALVSAARNFGFVFKERSPNSITIEVMDQTEVYELLCILDFNNVRKRMSVILRKNSQLRLYCKGADNVIYERLGDGDRDLKMKTQEHLNVSMQSSLSSCVVQYAVYIDHVGKILYSSPYGDIPTRLRIQAPASSSWDRSSTAQVISNGRTRRLNCLNQKMSISRPGPHGHCKSVSRGLHPAEVSTVSNRHPSLCYGEAVLLCCHLLSKTSVQFSAGLAAQGTWGEDRTNKDRGAEAYGRISDSDIAINPHQLKAQKRMPSTSKISWRSPLNLKTSPTQTHPSPIVEREEGPRVIMPIAPEAYPSNNNLCNTVPNEPYRRKDCNAG
ncbi:hypothetical protein PR048_003384 [Dryococelus australis]|uniref:Uncharacterized protein n=1 Tax=Dryococelus australis TaxID=614101 RepID=A0ABQ9IMZ3_9NEOP|nr:hypothetical protein PR048_003384 [Dryococelus australis]